VDASFPATDASEVAVKAVQLLKAPPDDVFELWLPVDWVDELLERALRKESKK
jgi:hypothetical protein